MLLLVVAVAAVAVVGGGIVEDSVVGSWTWASCRQRCRTLRRRKDPACWRILPESGGHDDEDELGSNRQKRLKRRWPVVTAFDRGV